MKKTCEKMGKEFKIMILWKLNDSNIHSCPWKNYPDRKIENTLELQHNIKQIDITDSNRIFHPTTQEYTFVSSTYGMFPWRGHKICHKSCLKNF